MKNTAWKKEYLVILHSEYNDTWNDLTKPLTFMQAIRFIRARKLNAALSANRAQIVTLTQWATQFDNKEVTA